MHEHGGDLVGKAVSTISSYGMLKGSERVLVSVSGGPDSVALLHFLLGIAEGMNLSLAVFHADHMMRGAESAEDARFVTDMAESLGLPSKSVTIDVKGEVARTGRSPQDAARALRLESLLDYADEWEADRVAMGHTADDQVETFLMRVVQGAGLTGLAAIGAMSGKIIRPLIEVWRFEVEAYLAAAGIAYRIDRTNLETAYLRNRIRLELIPFMVSEFGAAIKEVILREVESLGLDREYLQEQARTALQRAAKFEEDEVRVDRERLLEMPPSLQRGVIREAWARLQPGEPMLSWQHVLDIVGKIVGGSSGAVIDLPRDSVAEREYEEIVIRCRQPEQTEFEPMVLEVPGSVEVPWEDRIEAEVVDVAEAEMSPDPSIEYVRSDLKLPLEVRSPRPGDRFRPLGSPFQRKLKDFFIDVKLPRRERRKVLLVLDEGRIVWVAGLRLDDRYKLRPSDRQAIRLRQTGG